MPNFQAKEKAEFQGLTDKPKPGDMPPSVETDDFAFDFDYKHSPKNYRTQKAAANYMLGFIYGRMSVFGESIRYSSKAIELDSTKVEAYLNLINGYLSSEQYEEADRIFKLSLSKFPDNRLLKTYREQTR